MVWRVYIEERKIKMNKLIWGIIWGVIGAIATVITGWDKILAFINSITNIFQDLWNLFPVIQLGLLIWVLIWLGKNYLRKITRSNK